MTMVRSTVDHSKPLTPEEIQMLRALENRPIDYSDIPESSESDWKNAQRGLFYRPVKQPISLRLDSDVLNWLKSKGAGYQTRINSILRQAMQSDICMVAH